MTIQITRPEVEALIRQRLRSGAFKDVEDVIFQALQPNPAYEAEGTGKEGPHTGVELVAEMQASPYKEISLEPTAHRSPVRDVAI